MVAREFANLSQLIIGKSVLDPNMISLREVSSLYSKVRRMNIRDHLERLKSRCREDEFGLKNDAVLDAVLAFQSSTKEDRLLIAFDLFRLITETLNQNS